MFPTEYEQRLTAWEASTACRC